MSVLKASPIPPTQEAELEYPPDIIVNDTVGWYCLHESRPAILYGTIYKDRKGNTCYETHTFDYISLMIATKVLGLDIMQLPSRHAIENHYIYGGAGYSK